MDSSRPSRRWLYLVIGTVALLFAGIIYAWSILKAPLAGEFGWSASALSLNFTLTMCFFCFGAMLGGMLMKKLGFRVTVIISAALSAAGFLLTASMSGGIALLYVGYGVMSGLGIGIAYNCIISTVSAWFADKKGLCSGVLMMGFGTSALVLGSAADAIINAPSLGWRFSFRIIGIALGAVLLAAALILKKPEAGAAQSAASASSGKDYTAREMLSSGVFWKAFVCIVFLAAVGNTVVSMAKDLALGAGVSASAATALVGVLSVCNGLGRIITGAVFDKCGRRKTMLIANVAAICAAGITLASVLAESAPLCVAGLCLTGLSYGTCPTITSAFASEVFGTRYFSMNFPIMNCNLVFASFIATGASLISSATGGYAGAFVLLLALSVVALALNISANKKA